MNVRTAKRVLTTVQQPWAWAGLGLAGSVLVRVRPSADRHLAVGHALDRAGFPERALRHFDAAIACARRGDRAADVRWLHPAQFASEHVRYRLGRARVHDPLFACRVKPVTRTPRAPRASDAGRFAMELTDNGIRIIGFTRRGTKRVRIELDDEVIRAQATGGSEQRPEFTFTLRRATIAAFPPTATLCVRDDQGALLTTVGGGTEARVDVPHGTGDLVRYLGPEGTLDKKGDVPLGAAGLAERRSAYLDLYERARDLFATELDRPLFLMYGTLLGSWRDGDLIADDDDFDVGYASEETEPEAVKRETFGVIERLVEAGLAVSFNRRGRLFRLSDPAAPTASGPAAPTAGAAAAVHLDVRPLWFADGNAWAHNHFTMPSRRDDWLPVAEHRLGATRVLIPRHTERFLESHYGPTWRVPDPGFTYYRDAIPEHVWTYLARALIQPAEYRRLRATIERRSVGSAGSGTFASEAWDDLYPLP